MMETEIFTEILTSDRIRSFMDFVYNVPGVPDDPSWIWQQIRWNPYLAMAVYEDIEEKDAMVGSALDTRKDGVLSRSRRVLHADDTVEAKQLAAFIEETLENYIDVQAGERFGFDQVLFEALDAVGKGVSIGEIIYGEAADRIFIRAVRFKPQHLFAFGEVGKSPYSTSTYMYPQTGPLRLRPGVSVDGIDPDMPLPENKFLVHTYRPRYSNRWGTPLDRKVFWPSWFKRASVKQWLRFLEKGPGSVVARYRDGASTDEQNKALEAAQAINEEPAVALPAKFLVEVMQHVRQAMGSAYREMVDDFCNNEIARVILGQTLTSRGSEGGGSRALGEVHQQVRQEKIEVDAKSLMMCVNTQIVWPLVLLNFGPVRRPPVWVIDYDAQRDLETTANWLRKLWEMRVPISRKFVYKTFQLPAPTPGDELPLSDAGDAASAAFAEKKSPADAAEINARDLDRLVAGALRTAMPAYRAVMTEIVDELSRIDWARRVPARFFERFVPRFDQIGEVLGDAVLAAYLLAVDRTRDETGREIAFADPAAFDFDVEPRQAIEYFRRKRVLTRQRFNRLTDEARTGAFTVAGVYRDDVLTAFKDEIEAALRDGTPQSEVIARFREILRGAGHRDLGASHLETVFRTNMQVAYGVGRRRALAEVVDDFPYWRYRAVLDDRTRPTHRALDGLILPADHPFWQDHFPPWEWNCRCTITPTDSIPDDYDAQNPSGLARIAYDEKGRPAKAEIGTTIYDLAAERFRGVPPSRSLQEVLEEGARRGKEY